MVRLDLLRHLAEAKVNTAVAGPAVAEFVVPDGDVRVLWGPLGDDPALLAVPGDGAMGRMEDGGGWVVYNPADVRARLAAVTEETAPSVGDTAVRIVSVESRRTA